MAKNRPVKREKIDLKNVKQELSAWLDRATGTPNEELVAEIIQTALKLAGDGADRGDLKILIRSLKELRYAFKVFARYRSVR
ncbi:MAG: cytochrome D ubiquinol oxidase subunit II, partial [Candidatus Binatia bacterium]